MAGSYDYYFAYGSNMNVARMQERQMDFDHAEGGVLSDFRLAFNKRSTKQIGVASANVVHCAGSCVEGVVYRLLDSDCIARMDPYEGYPLRYDRRQLPIQLSGGDQQSAWVYIANPDYIDETLKPARWYLNHLLAGREHLSESYYQQLLQVPCNETPPDRTG
ncbi:MAG: gamma-glutamylcyclotransferase family protein [Pseudomonadales bacterium]|nr:gamma-glutamylcyclotransferase family protein [Pseudomonadales bacterium]HJL52951.1 gamma-glutamylcyclotransferase family protein [Arenicellales bacterium]MDP7144446.1 gamma-glutamylcyclotransferase family protein [Pseudomonadales bacterium]MDP7359629.1 gamma-glutamylcyclotransferase family protein [Pseudomonadales bacterium]MDP7595942.1 gamma-glutamylcyclotransferase family protein [Pseudomonadales bacterium]